MSDPERIPVEVSLVTAPNGKPGVLLQFTEGYLLMTNPDQVGDLTLTLAAARSELVAALSKAN